MENRKLHLMERCTVHKEENLKVSRILATFSDKHDALQAWLTNVVKVFLQKHQDIGSDLAMACDFRRIHCQLLAELENKSEEVDHLELEILPIVEGLDEIQKYELSLKIKNLEDEWTKIKIAMVKRIELCTIYIQFHEIVEELTHEMDSIDNEMKKYEDVLDEARFNKLEKRWQSFESLYKKLDNHAKAFLNETNNVSNSYKLFFKNFKNLLLLQETLDIIQLKNPYFFPCRSMIVI